METPAHMLLFLTAAEAETLDAITAILIPGTPEDPGAREAGVLTFIDHMLATADGWAEPTYLEPPFVKTYEGETPPPEADTDTDFVYIPKDRAEDYGWQVAAPPQTLYRVGLAKLVEAVGGDFAGLSEDQQEALLGQLADDELAGFETDIPMFSGAAFFDMLLTHTRLGMFGDPLYGGNRFLVGWQLVATRARGGLTPLRTCSPKARRSNLRAWPTCRRSIQGSRSAMRSSSHWQTEPSSSSKRPGAPPSGCCSVSPNSPTRRTPWPYRKKWTLLWLARAGPRPSSRGS